MVGVRVRPLNEREMSSPDFAHAWTVDAKTVARTVSASRNQEPLSFVFDSVFEPTSTNEDVYDCIAAPIVENALGGFNATIFAYGQTSSGKTHTMLGSDADAGVTPRAIEHVLRHASASKTRKYHVRASYVEIYNDKIHDLQRPDRSDLQIRQDKAGRVYVEAEETIVETLADAMNILKVGQESRHVGETQMNARSSRSHTVFSLLIESKDDVGMDRTIRASSLNLVDLAGSERLKSTGAQGQRAKEGAHINKSLLVLGNIINRLSKYGNDPAKLGHLPYRESKLTRLLRPALGGNAKTAVLCAMTPSNMHVDETISTLKFAERAKKIQNNASRNEVVDFRAKYKQAAVELAVLKEKLSALENEHASFKKKGVPHSGSLSPASTLSDLSSPRDSDISVVVTTPSVAEVVGLRLDVEALKEELEYMKKHVDEVEIENEHLRAQMRKKNSEYRDLRSRTQELRQTASVARRKERETCRALVMAYTKLEEARAQLEVSKKKGAHVKLAESLLDELSTSLEAWLPMSTITGRRSSAASTLSSSKSMAMMASGTDARARIAREIGRDSRTGRQLLDHFAFVAEGEAGRSSTRMPTPPPNWGTPERRQRARPLPHDLVMDIDDEEAEREEQMQSSDSHSTRSSPDRLEDAHGVAVALGPRRASTTGVHRAPHARTDSIASVEPTSSNGALVVGRPGMMTAGAIAAAAATASPGSAKGKMRGWQSFKAFYGYGLTRSNIYEIVGGHQISSASKHVSA